MTKEEIYVCKKYNINPLYTNIKPYILANRMENSTRKFEKFANKHPEEAKKQAEETLQRIGVI